MHSLRKCSIIIRYENIEEDVMLDLIKRQWFVTLVALVFIIFSIFCIYDSRKDIVSSKSSKGKDVIASVKGNKNIYADDLYKTLYATYGKSTIGARFQVAVINKSSKTTKAVEKKSRTFKTNYLNQAESKMKEEENETDIKSYINSQLQGLGYSYETLDEYCILMVKTQKLRDAYINKDLTALFDKVSKDKNPMVVSHILIKMEDSKKPTDAEKAKVKAVEDALKKGDSFEKVAEKYSDDSAENGGFLGYMDDDTEYVDSFKTAAKELKKGEVSDWVKESNANYNGWHKIKCEEKNKKAILKDKRSEVKEGVYQACANTDENMYGKYIWEAAEKMKIKYASKSVKNEIRDALGLNEKKETETQE